MEGKKKRILFFSLCYYPEKTGIAVTSTELCEWLAGRGNEVDVICGFPFYPEWKVKQGYRSKLFMNEKIKGVHLRRSWVYVPKKINTTSRILHELSFEISAFIRALFLSRPDIVICTIPPLSLGITGLLIAKIKRVKSVLNVKDLQPDAAIELGMIKNKYVIGLMYRLESFFYRHYEKISSLGHGVLKRIENKGVSPLKLLYLPDTAPPEMVAMPSKIEHNRFIERNNLKEGFKVLHAGNMGVKQGIEIILKTAKLLEDTPVEFLIVGDGAKKDELIKMKEQMKLANVTFLPLQPKEILPDMILSADIFLLTQRKEVVDIVVPSKLISAMSAGSCLVASVHSKSEAAAIVNQSRCGITVEPENPEALKEGILKYLENPELIEKCRVNGKQYVSEYFDREKVFKSFDKELFES